MPYNNLKIVHSIDSKKQHISTTATISFHIKHNYISRIASKTGEDIRDEYYHEIYSIDKNSESVYYLVKWKSESYRLNVSQKLVYYVIKAG